MQLPRSSYEHVGRAGGNWHTAAAVRLGKSLESFAASTCKNGIRNRADEKPGCTRCRESGYRV